MSDVKCQVSYLCHFEASRRRNEEVDTVNHAAGNSNAALLSNGCKGKNELVLVAFLLEL